MFPSASEKVHVLSFLWLGNFRLCRLKIMQSWMSFMSMALGFQVTTALSVLQV